MFNLIRRISYGVIPRPDRPWEEDATSNAPAPRRKRRLSSTERDLRDASEELARSKKARSHSQSPEAEAEEKRDTPLPQPQAETKEVKEVTQGVKEVVLDEPSEEAVECEGDDATEDSVLPQSVPLPEDELDDLEDAPSSPAGSEEESATSEQEAREANTAPGDLKVEALSTEEDLTEKEKSDGLEAAESTDATRDSPKQLFTSQD